MYGIAVSTPGTQGPSWYKMEEGVRREVKQVTWLPYHLIPSWNSKDCKNSKFKPGFQVILKVYFFKIVRDIYFYLTIC